MHESRSVLQPPVAVRCSVFLSLLPRSLLLAHSLSVLYPILAPSPSLFLRRAIIHPPGPLIAAQPTHIQCLYISAWFGGRRGCANERDREREGGGGRKGGERERGAELTHHGNGKWDAAEYRWTLTGMRVRITECHPYSAGLAAVSGQCYRYISIITFSLAAQRSAAFRYTHAATPRCIAHPPAVSRSHHAVRFASRRIVCKRDARPRLSHLRFDPRLHGYAGLTSNLRQLLAAWLDRSDGIASS